MPYLIDGHNLIGKQGKLGQNGCEEELIKVIKDFCFKKNKKATLVFDGRQFSREMDGPVTIKFSDRNYDADKVIKDCIQDESNKKNLIVVSSDNEIREFAYEAGCQIMKSEEFNKILCDNFKEQACLFPTDNADKEVSDDEARDWLEWFGK